MEGSGDRKLSINPLKFSKEKKRADSKSLVKNPVAEASTDASFREEKERKKALALRRKEEYDKLIAKAIAEVDAVFGHENNSEQARQARALARTKVGLAQAKADLEDGSIEAVVARELDKWKEKIDNSQKSKPLLSGFGGRTQKVLIKEAVPKSVDDEEKTAAFDDDDDLEDMAEKRLKK
ncbi:MAG: hypothetical protein WC797_03600 [Candidatus Paceibacterota bacterium]|jgi:hypothetical protein